MIDMQNSFPQWLAFYVSYLTMQSITAYILKNGMDLIWALRFHFEKEEEKVKNTKKAFWTLTW